MCMMKVAVTLASGICSVAKATLPINAELLVIEPLAFSIASENAVHGQNAIARYGTNPISAASGSLALNMLVNTNAYTASKMIG